MFAFTHRPVSDFKSDDAYYSTLLPLFDKQVNYKLLFWPFISLLYILRYESV